MIGWDKLIQLFDNRDEIRSAFYSIPSAFNYGMVLPDHVNKINDFIKVLLKYLPTYVFINQDLPIPEPFYVKDGDLIKSEDIIKLCIYIEGVLHGLAYLLRVLVEDVYWERWYVVISVNEEINRRIAILHSFYMPYEEEEEEEEEEEGEGDW